MIPLQAVITEGGERICYVRTAMGSQPRSIETGDYNDRFIEIKEGLAEGEKVVLNAGDLIHR
jgi:hypothetical protein